MKTFKQLVNEVAEPISPDEQRFKAKHVIKKIDHPIDGDSQEVIFKGKTVKDRTRKADYQDDTEYDYEYDGEDEEVYESTKMGSIEVKSDDDRKARASAARKKMADRMAKKFGVMVKATQKEEAENLDELSKGTTARYLAKAAKDTGERAQMAGKFPNASKKSKEDFNRKRKNREDGVKTAVKKLSQEQYIDEAVKAGSMKLNDGSSVKVTSEDAQVMNNLFSELNSSNKKRMEEEMMKSKDGFDKILKFAKEAS